MLVWRLEQTTGTRLGVFRSGDIDKVNNEVFYQKYKPGFEGPYCYDRHPDDPHKMPTPFWDGMADISPRRGFTREDYFFGFKDIKQYYKAIKPAVRKALCNTNTKLVRYEVKKEDVMVGRSQVAFIRKLGKVVKEYKPTYRERKKSLTVKN